jgi:hypothetical protein
MRTIVKQSLTNSVSVIELINFYLSSSLHILGCESLTDEDISSIKMMAIRLFGHISQRNYERIRFSFRENIRLLTLQRLHTRVAALSGVKAIPVPCCVNICHAFTRQYADERECSKCGQPRFDYKGRPRQTFEYLPFTARLQSLFNNLDLIRLMTYRKEYVQRPGAMGDIFDSKSYKDLCARPLVVNGKPTGDDFFAGDYDIATSLLADGVQIFQQASQENNTCWPLMLQNLNLPPTERVKLRNLIPLGVIPGPNQPRDFDSFLVPFVEECITSAQGVKTYNALTKGRFTMRHHPLIVCGDMQAMKHFEQLKGAGGVCGCRECEMPGTYHTLRRTYYYPLAPPIDMPNSKDDSNAEPGVLDSWDPLNLPLRTEARMIKQLDRMESAPNQKAYDDLGKKYGIAGRSILDEIPSIQRPTSYPHEFMHLFLLNHGPELVALWTNSYKGIFDEGSGNYFISKSDWVQIGLETESATRLIPAAFIRPLPNIQTGRHLYCAEAWSFWFIYVGPIVLRGRLAKRCYEHFLELVSIIKCLLQLSNTTARLEELRVEVASYVETHEK